MKTAMKYILFLILFFSVRSLYSFEFILIDGRIIRGEFEKNKFTIKDDSGKDHQISIKDIYSIKQNKKALYLNTDYKYAFDIPDGWTLETDSAVGSRLIQLKGPEKHGGKITIMSQSFQPGRTFFDFVQESLKDIQKNEFKLLKKSVFHKTGFDDGLKFDLDILVSGKILCTEQISLYRSSISTNILITCVYHPAEKTYFTALFSNFIKFFKAL